MLVLNGIAVLSEDRFLARGATYLLSCSPPHLHSSLGIDAKTCTGFYPKFADFACHAVNLSPSSYDPAFGQPNNASVKARVITLIASVRTLMRGASVS